jgi:cell division protein FtsI/penicillin-binding protein 2
MVIQKIVEDELVVAMKDNHPLSAACVVVRPSTGAILAMGEYPNYDPNQPAAGPLDSKRNRIIADQMEPGSTFKIVAVAAALDQAAVQLHELFDCEKGRWLFRGRSLSDHEAYGILSVEEILVKSSNIGTAKIGVRLGEDKLYQYIRAFGFDSRSGIALSGEGTGTVHPVKKWDKLMISRIPMGQAVAVTHLQMVMAMSAIANKGRLMRPMLVDRLQQPDGTVYAQYHPQQVRQVVSEATARQVVEALTRVVSSEGTAVKAKMDHYTVAGKTGTAEKPGPGGYMDDKYIASFIGFFPADAPEVCISVVLDEPKGGYYGGLKAAPVFKRIAEQVAQYLKIRPDREEFGPNPVTGEPGGRSLKTASLPHR